ncbi:MAG: endolytic transglycosylase MltG [Coriobacteriia bacterium]|nr:endolytic transglycosylase MltG [Coriobacteriia bacterium]
MPLAILGLLIVLALTAGATGWYLLLKPDSSGIAAGQSVEIVIDSGTSTAGIGGTLSSAGVVDNARMFRLKARNSDVAGKLKAGTYAFVTGSRYEDVLAKLTKGPDIVYYDVVIPEGFTITQIAARFAKQAGVPEDELLALLTTGASQFAADRPHLADTNGGSLEGFLFPATYRIKEGTTSEQIVIEMLDAFDENMASVDMTFATSKNLTVFDVVTIASILEREAKVAKERPLVSSVIYNRLNKGMRLQLCATVLYEMPVGSDKVTYEDTKRDTPYNTYVHDGLPPGPISNPGLASLEAAAHPADTKYLYYVLTGKDGSQTFCETYDQFQKAVKVNRQNF